MAEERLSAIAEHDPMHSDDRRIDRVETGESWAHFTAYGTSWRGRIGFIEGEIFSVQGLSGSHCGDLPVHSRELFQTW